LAASQSSGWQLTAGRAGLTSLRLSTARFIQSKEAGENKSFPWYFLPAISVKRETLFCRTFFLVPGQGLRRWRPGTLSQEAPVTVAVAVKV
jgi:hypothetical protein